MKTSSPERIRELTEQGFWGQDTLHSLLDDCARSRPDQLAVADQPNKAELCGFPARRLDFSSLQHYSSRLASELLANGVRADDRLLVQLPNISELVALYYACSRIGAIISPIPVQYGAHEIQQFATALKPAAFVSLADFRGEDLCARASGALGDIPVWVFGEAIGAGEPEDAFDAEALAGHQAANPTDANDIVTMCWTSGTTGTPKGVPRSHNMWIAIARNTMEAGDYQAGEILLAPFPLINMAAIGGFLFPSALLGASLVLHHPMDPPLYLKQLQDEGATFTIAPPALLNQLAHQPALWQQGDFSALRAFGSGSVPLSPAMIATVEGEYGKNIINFYGSNEGISLFSTPDTAPEPEYRAALFPRLGVAGMPWQGRAHASTVTRVIDPDSGAEITDPGVPGELCISGPAVFDGYLDHDGIDVFTADGMFRTGDLVEIAGDPPNYYRIVGRCKDIINRGGMKISPSDLDTVLEGHPDLAEVAVCAYADPMMGEKICACVVPTTDAEPPTVESLGQWLLDQGVARFKLPERIEILAALPRNPVGKVVRGDLQKLIEKESSS
ncbi:(2,3-dihydroxybenzoyl)adenylate synthase [Seongchinamella sediminis]|uniref:(2,3-dihydroxybenzoyl)adenylate synthase n=1 Tax=Seongchinamella sediminis TaxID=2283635 RepID=A0A3L7E0T4_9GAMM|nr:class I adenylate-forming enzyme family protein [Seongchinamella sediminis]RLQ22535.1 (2,3-dihydroxybenzoyl)adenylate synthase [Seongchinamella sediminis]